MISPLEGQLLKSQGKTLHYDVSAEAWLVGTRSGQFHVDGHADINFPLFGDTVKLAATAQFLPAVLQHPFI